MLYRRVQCKTRRARPFLANETRRLIVALAGLAALAAVFFSVTTSASPTGSLAETLFREGRNLIDEKRYDEACEKFAESQRLDPAGGTLLNLASCHELQGKTATAWSEFHEALAWARADNNANRVRFALEHIAAIEPKLPRALITVPEAARVPGLTVTLDGTELSPAAWGTHLPLDPGEHVVEARARGRETFTDTFLASAGDIRTVTVPPLALAPEPFEVSTGTPRAEGATFKLGPSGLPGEHASTTAQDVGGYASLGLGAIGFGVGTYYGLRAASARDEYGKDSDEANDAATAANVAFVAGGVFAATGIVLLVFDADGEDTGDEANVIGFPMLAPGVAGAGVLGRF